MNKFFINYAIFSLSCFVLSCNNNFNIQNETKTPSSSSSLLENKNFSLPESKKNDEIIDTMDLIKNKLIKDQNNKSFIKSNELKTIVVIYKNEYFVRVDEKNNKLKENTKINYSQLTNLLEKYKIKNMIDSTTNDNIEELDEEQKNNSKSIVTEVSHSMSIHYYSFPEESDTLEVCQELRKLPFVLKAYPEIRAIGADS